MTPMPDTLAPEHVKGLLNGRFGSSYHYEETCVSTQKLLDGSEAEGAIAVCESQSEGRGRLGRGWEAPARTAILCSVLLRPPPQRRAAELSLVGGVAAAQAVEFATGLAVQIKWPNDVMLNRRKVAGVLAETQDGAVVLGIGLNVNQTREQLPQEARVPVGSLYTTDAVLRSRAPLLADLVAWLERDYTLWCGGGLGALFDELGARDFLRGRVVVVDGARGVAVGIDRQGRLAIDVEGERRLVESGEIDYER